MPVRVEESPVYSSDMYSLKLVNDRPYATLCGGDGQEIAQLLTISAVHSDRGLDDAVSLGSWTVAEESGTTTFSLEVGSSLWERKVVRFRCGPERLLYEVEVEGTGAVTQVTYFAGTMSALPRWGSGFFSSSNAFGQVFNPEPNTADRNELPPHASSVIDLTGAPLPGKRHWFFTPPPFCFSAQIPSGWLGIGVEAAPGDNTFSEYRYHGGDDGFWLSLQYGGQVVVHGRQSLPSIGFNFGRTAYDVLAAHADSLRRTGLAPVTRREKPAWWSRPMFCGWGAQCARAADEWGRDDAAGFLRSLPHAAEYARQSEYDAFLQALDDWGIHPGTVVLDDKWQSTYGENMADQEKWPDLSGFIAQRHARGQRVLLWIKAWDREGIPDDECICNAAGIPLAVDPTNPSYDARLRSSVRRMLGAQGYDADGFKIDFTHRIPVGPSLRSYECTRGIELMKRYLGTIYDEAKRTKPDALIMTHTPHPYLADVTDMIRLNDMLDLTRLDLPEAGMDIARTVALRAAVARIACPDALIDTDNWPVRNREVWREYVRLQPRVGVPSLYFSTHIDLTGEPLEEADYHLLREAWNGIDSTRPVPAR